MFPRNFFLENLSRFVFLLAGTMACLGLVMIVIGYPAPLWLPKFLGVKSIRKIFQLLFLLSAAGIVIHPKRKEWLERFFLFLKTASQGWKGITALILVYSLLFLWNQLTAYWSVNINFIPFSFYNYMLYYFWLGKINYTALLHGFYHSNYILYCLAPLWLLFKNSLVLVVVHGPILALGALPIFLITQRLFRNSWIPLALSFFYLNSRYLLNLLEMDFLVESFYPFLICFIFYFLLSGRRIAFLVSTLLVLLLKEDASFYMLALGFFLLFVRSRRTYGVGMMILAVSYAFILVKVLLPILGSDILAGSARNFKATGSNPAEVLRYHLTHPLIYFQYLFWPSTKLQTILKLLTSTFFLPLLSPWCLLVLVALLPPFAQGDINFVNLRFHYSAVVIPFLFFAFLKGFQNLYEFLEKYRSREFLLRILIFLLITITGGNYLSHSLTSFKLDTIREVSKIPPQAVVVTQGHLLPYIGYRAYNFYIAGPYERGRGREDNIYKKYYNADYYFIARSVDSYPYDRSWMEKKIEQLKRDPQLELIYDDGEKVLLKRKEGMQE